MQAESYEIKGQQIPLLRLAQKVASTCTSEEEAKEIIDIVKKANPPRAEQLIALRYKTKIGG